MRRALHWILAASGVLAFGSWQVPAWAGRISDIANTKHNFSVSGTGEIRATSEDEVCVFCHTPHQANTALAAPLWNRQLSTATYTPYTSSSLDAIGLDQPGGSSKLCLSCHDGTIAIGNVNVLNGAFTGGTPVPGLESTMPIGQGALTGFTRLLGTNLTNDHPISFTYDDALASRDGELRAPTSTTYIKNRVPGVFPKVPLENGQLQCTSCHDPHVRDTIETNIKFLRLNRFQKSPPVQGAFNENNDILCLACHIKEGWADSAHGNSLVADETYASTAANLREFYSNIKVWEAACLNCHDPHTVQGARRLLREGTDSISSPKSGGSSAIEETCYQCHSATGGVLVNQGAVNFPVPDIKSDFALPRRMPINTQPEVHDIGTGSGTQLGKDFIESQANMGYGDPTKRHAECTDCHNPHRVIKNRLFNASAGVPDAAGTHSHASGHTNIASGVLRGTWGVEPVYGSDAFMSNPTSYTVKRGNPAPGSSTLVSSPYVTREYQICLKCHSDYAYVTPPDLGCCTPYGTNGLTQYTNQAMEFQAPASHKGEPGGNHRSWHPVIDNTGRSTTVRQAGANNWLAPWNGTADIGTQTMYCSDCHGTNTGSQTVVPDGNSGTEDGRPWGPHGSTNDFILKGTWSASTGVSDSGTGLCFKCHSYTLYATRGGGSSGFGGSKDPNLHSYHADKIGKMRCTWCHVAVPHGWKNKALVVNLNDVGTEVGLSPQQVRNNTTAAYSRPPYYLNAMNKVRTWASSGSWAENNCGSAGAPGNGQSGRDWMRDSNENCKNPP
jgi:hypothetical protein